MGGGSVHLPGTGEVQRWVYVSRPERADEIWPSMAPGEGEGGPLAFLSEGAEVDDTITFVGPGSAPTRNRRQQQQQGGYGCLFAIGLCITAWAALGLWFIK
jgi:hypothetical protein